jgi:hypothetical protein
MSFETIETINIDTQTINGLAYPPSGTGLAAGDLNIIQLSMGDGSFKAAGVKILDDNTISADTNIQISEIADNHEILMDNIGVSIVADNNLPIILLSDDSINIGTVIDETNYKQTTLIPTTLLQKLGVSSLGPPAVVTFIDPVYQTLAQGTIQINSTANSTTGLYLMSSTINGDGQGSNAQNVTGMWLGDSSTTKYRLKVVLYSNGNPLSAGSISISAAPFTIASAGSGNSCNYTVSSLPLSQINLTSVELVASTSPSVYHSSIFTVAVATPHLFYCSVVGGTTWNSNKLINVTAYLQQLV